MKPRPSSRPCDPAPPPLPGLDAHAAGYTYTGEMTDGTPPQDWPLLADLYVPFFARHPEVQQRLGYRLSKAVLRHGDIPPNPRFSVFTHEHYSLLWALLFPMREPSDTAAPWPQEFSRNVATALLTLCRHNEPEALPEILQVASGRWVLYNGAVVCLLLEHCAQEVEYHIAAFNTYYEGHMTPIRVEDEADLSTVVQAFVHALWDTHPLERVHYAINDPAKRNPRYLLGPDWKLDVMERFKTYLWRTCGQPSVDFSGLNDRQFVHAFEAWWSRTLCFPDHGYGFAVMPAFTIEDMVRYALKPNAPGPNSPATSRPPLALIPLSHQMPI